MAAFPSAVLCGFMGCGKSAIGQLAAKEPDVLFGGRLADYQYYDMDKTIEAALRLAGREFGEDGKGLKA